MRSDPVRVACRRAPRHATHTTLGLLVVFVVTALAAPATVAAATPAPSSVSPAEPAFEFLADHFPLKVLNASQLPYHAWPDPPLPPTWTPTDADGIKMRLWNGRLYYHPVELGYLALRFISAYERTRLAGHLRWARRYAAKIRELAIWSGGALFVPYRFDYGSERLRAPWYSGMSQGLAISVSVRLFRLTHETRYRTDARHYFASFQRSGPSSRPWVSRISPAGYLWIEEYPRNDRWDQVLNGFIFAVFGLYEYWKLVGGDPSRRVLEGTLTTLKSQVMRYRVPGGISYYCLYHRTRHATYHLVHIEQLRFLALMSGDRYFDRVADLFEADYPGTAAPEWQIPGIDESLVAAIDEAPPRP